MIRLFKLLLVSFLCLNLLNCSDGNSNDIEYSSKYEGIYLKTVNGIKRLCYENYDEENLRNYASDKDDLRDVQPEDVPGVGGFTCCQYSVPNNYNMEKKFEKYDLINKDGWIVYGGPYNEYTSQEFMFFDDGSVYTLSQQQHYYSSVHEFTTYKLHSLNGKYYLTLYFYDIKLSESDYGENFEKLTIEDIELKQQITYLYLPSERFGFYLVYRS